MVEEWPVAASGRTSERSVQAPSTRAPLGAGDRIAAVRVDFFLDPALRLTEQDRALMTAMLHGLIGGIADELRVRLPDDLARRSECLLEELVAMLAEAGLLSSDRLITMLVYRADSARAAQVAPRNGSGALLTTWSGDEDPNVAAAAMALVIARGRSRDRYGRPGVALADCHADVAIELVHAVAAALAIRLPNAARGDLAASATDLLSRHDEEQRADALEARLVLSLEAAGKIEPELVLALARGGEAGLMAETLSRMAGISGEDSWCLAMQPGGLGLPLLLRLANQPRTTAAALFVECGQSFGISDPAEAIDRFDAIGDEAAEVERRHLRLPPLFRAAMKALDARG